MTTEQVAIDRKALSKATRKGLIGAFWLAVLTIVEFIIADIGNGQSWALWALLPFVVAKGWIILDTFMHIRALWSEDH
jgi:hypothetical protein